MPDKIINSDFNPTANAGTRTLLDYAQRLLGLTARAGVNQIRGNNPATATGAGIPKQVTNVTAAVANASSGATSTVTITFQRDPTDTAFAGVNILVKGYNGTQIPSQVASGTDSPIQFILNNTGEAVSITVQAYGNSGNAPLGFSPTTGIQLPKGTGGGFGTTTVTQVTQASPTYGLDLAAVTASTQKVVGLEGNPIDGTLTLLDGDVYRWSVTAGKWEKAMMWDWLLVPGAVATTPVWFGSGSGAFIFNNSLVAVGTASAVAGTATQLAGLKYTTSSSASTEAGFINNSVAAGQTAALGILRRTRFRAQLNQTTNIRIWIGLQTDTGVSNVVWGVDTKTTSFIGFRYSTHASDTTWQAVTNNGGVQTTTNTGVAVDTNVHNFDIIYNAGTVKFYIDGTLVATVSTNVPANTTLCSPGFMLDNVALANAVPATFYYAKGTVDWALM